MKVKSLKIIKEDKIRRRLNRKLVAQITGTKDDELDKFMIFCNINIDLTESDTKESVAVKVIDLYMEYQHKLNIDVKNSL